MLSSEDFEPSTRLVDRLAVEFVRKCDAARTPPDYTDHADPEHEQLATILKALNAELRLLLKPHLREKNLDALAEVIAYFGTPASMQRFTSEPACFAELVKMADSLRKMYYLD